MITSVELCAFVSERSNCMFIFSVSSYLISLTLCTVVAYIYGLGKVMYKMLFVTLACI